MRFLFLLLISGSLFGQTYDFNTSAMDGWTLTTGQPNAGWHSPSAMCTNTSGAYYTNNNYIFLSPTFDYSSCTDVSVTVNVSYNIRKDDAFYVSFYYAGVLQPDIPINSGTSTITVPNTVTQMRFFMTTFSNGGLVNKYCHMNWVNIVCNTPLPIELLYFEATKKDKFNSIDFVTETEINNDYFIIQRSDNGINFKDIAQINGNGNTNTPSMYSFKDYNFEYTTNYYRLIQFDFDGKETIIGPVVVNNINNDSEQEVKRIKLFNNNGDGFYIYYYGDRSELRYVK